MNKTIYLRDDEVPVWERAREISGDKLSPVIVANLKQYVAAHEAPAKGHERIVVRYYEKGIPRAKAFYGRWIIPPTECYVPPPPEPTPRSTMDVMATIQAGIDLATATPETHYFAVAESQKGKFVVLEFTGVENKQRDFEQGAFLGGELHVIESLAFVNHEVRTEVQSEALKRIGVIVQELDI